MIVYVAADVITGRVLSLHHAVDADGHDIRCRDEDVLGTLPPGTDRDRVVVLSTQLDGMPSGREAILVVDAQRRAVVLQPVRRPGEHAAPPATESDLESGDAGHADLQDG